MSAYIMKKESVDFIKICSLFSEQSGYYSLFGTKDAKEIIEGCKENKKLMLTKNMIVKDLKKSAF